MARLVFHPNRENRISGVLTGRALADSLNGQVLNLLKVVAGIGAHLLFKEWETAALNALQALEDRAAAGQQERAEDFLVAAGDDIPIGTLKT